MTCHTAVTWDWPKANQRLDKLLEWHNGGYVIILTSAQNNGDLRLARGVSSSTSYTSGRLEIYYNGQWGTVCDDSWGISDSHVACRQLGYFGAISPYSATSSSTGWAVSYSIGLLSNVLSEGILVRAWASPTLARLHCKMRVYVCLLAYMWPYTEI